MSKVYSKGGLYLVEGVRDAQPQKAEYARVKQAAELSKAIKWQYHHCCEEAPEELRKHVGEGRAPVAVKHQRRPQNPSRVEGRTGVGPTCAA